MIDPRALERLMETLGGDPADLADIIESFLEEGPTLLASMQQAIAAGDGGMLKRAAHSLKSNARDLGAEKLASMCQAVESGIKQGDDGQEHVAAVAAILVEWEGVAPALVGEMKRLGRSA